MFTLAALLLFGIISLSSIFYWVYLWQLKEYRLDRLFVHLRDTNQGRKILFSFNSGVLLLGFIMVGISVFVDVISKYLSIIIFLLFSLYTLRIVFQILDKKFKKPVFTVKALAISLLSFLLVWFTVLFPLADFSAWLLIVLFIVPLTVAFCIFVFAFPTEIYTDIYIQKAKEWRKNFPNLQVIAVSGSYGKSSTKEIIAHILSEKYHVVKTDFSNNTPLVIAKTILDKIHSSTNFFVVELGAYKRGEIKQLAEMVGPTIGITTAVSDQHIALYGDMNDIILSEAELLKELPKNALVLFNGNSEGVKRLFPATKRLNPIWFVTSRNIGSQKVITGFNTSETGKSTEFDYSYKRNFIHFSSPLLGKHTVENILPGIFLGLHFGLSEVQIKQRIKTLSPLPKTMEMRKIMSGVTIIDDSFNASPESVASALDFLKNSHKRKMFVLSPLIELGKFGKERHREIGRKLAAVDYVFLTNKNFFNDIQKGIQEKKGKTVVITGPYAFLAKYIRSILEKGDTIIFEGKEAGVVLSLL